MRARRQLPKTGQAKARVVKKTRGRAKTRPEDRSGEDMRRHEDTWACEDTSRRQVGRTHSPSRRQQAVLRLPTVCRPSVLGRPSPLWRWPSVFFTKSAVQNAVRILVDRYVDAQHPWPHNRRMDQWAKQEFALSPEEGCGEPLEQAIRPVVCPLKDWWGIPDLW